MPASPMPFVGRQRELTTLQARLKRAAAGHGGLVLVADEPGIGKTRLLAALRDRAAARGWLVLAGRADDGGGLPPYLPFLAALSSVLAGRTAHELRTLLGAAAPGVALLMPPMREL